MNLFANLNKVAQQSQQHISLRDQQKRISEENAQLKQVMDSGQAQKKDWLEAVRADNVLIYMESGQQCRAALDRCSGCLTVASLCLVLGGQPEDNLDVRIMRGAQSAIAQAITHNQETPSADMVSSISVAMERAATAIEEVHPIVFMKVLHTLDQYRASVDKKKTLNS